MGFWWVFGGSLVGRVWWVFGGSLVGVWWVFGGSGSRSLTTSENDHGGTGGICGFCG